MRGELIHQVRAELGPRAALGAAAVCHYLAAAAVEQILDREASCQSLRQDFHHDRHGTIGRIYPLAESGCRQAAETLPASLRAEGLLPAGCPATAFADPQYLERVVHLALERALINPAAPPLLIAPRPEPERMPTLYLWPVVAVLFDQPLGITHELYPLWTDAYASALSRPPFALVGVHTSWLGADGRARRAMFFDPELDLFLEAPLETPVRLAAALLLCQSRQVHASVAAGLQAAAVPHLNPYSLAAVADDKWACFTRWTAGGVQTPPTCLLPRQATAGEVRAAIGAFIGREQPCPPGERGWVIQPRHGTEGEQVSWVEAGPAAVDALLRAWQGIAIADDAILRPRVGAVCLASTAGPRPFDLRVHVGCDGAAWAAESGYLLVAPSTAAPISSVARGGQVQPLSRLEEAGLVREDGTPVPWQPADLECLRSLAIRSAQAIGPFGLAGVDVKLDLQNGRLEPSVLDLNPRPAGLLHADLFTTQEPGIGAGLWRRVRSLLAVTA